MQKQEIKSKRRSRELEGPSSWREHRAMMSHHDRRVARDRQVMLQFDTVRCPLQACVASRLVHNVQSAQINRPSMEFWLVSISNGLGNR